MGDDDDNGDGDSMGRDMGMDTDNKPGTEPECNWGPGMLRLLMSRTLAPLSDMTGRISAAASNPNPHSTDT